MKNIFLIIILLILFIPNKPSTPKVNADDFIFGPDSLAIASLMVIMDDNVAVVPDIPVVPTADCNCKNGKVSYDGGTSLTDCPCVVKGGVNTCKCPSCPCNKPKGDAVPVSTETAVKIVIPPEQDVISNESIFDNYYIGKATATWCGPCIGWNTRERSNFENAGIKVVDKDVDTDLSFVEMSNVQEVPHFFVFTAIDGIMHNKPKGGLYGHRGPDFGVKDAEALILELDNSIHPNRKDGLYYDRQQKEQTMLNKTYWASKAEYIVHLRSHANHKEDIKGWPLEKLSQYELKAIHDDDHANMLGKLNGI